MTDTPTYPVIFSGPMIRALLDGRKTQTRRLAWTLGKLVPVGRFHEAEGMGHEIKPSPWKRRLDRWRAGDRELWIWVRETWKPRSSAQLRAVTPVIYRAEYTFPKLAASLGPWRSSIHMPRWASRLSLQVADMRMEKLQDISEEDARAEGIKWSAVDPETDNEVMSGLAGVDAFACLWDSIHGPGSWEANPEVIAITFTVHQRNIDAIERAA